MNVHEQPLLEFAGFALDRATRTLRTTGGLDVNLRPKSFDVLCLLVARAGALVTREEIFQEVWPGVVVTDESVSRCVSDIRLALGDGVQKLIKTVPRRGYVFVAPVMERSRIPAMPEVAALRAIPAQATSPARARRRWIFVATAIAVAAAVVTVLRTWAPADGLPMPDRPSIVVLPFENVGTDPREDYFSDGLTQDVTVRLAKFGDLFVIARDSALAYKHRPVEPRRVARELGVRYLLSGSVRRDGEQFRIVAHLVDASAGTQVWAESYDREMTDLFAVQDELAQKIVVTLAAHVTKAELDRALRKPPETLAAYDHYLRGIAVLALVDASPVGQYGERLLEARQHLDRAVAADPRYAPALVALSDTWNRAWLVPAVNTPAEEEFRLPAASDRALSLARAAVDADPSLAEAHAQLAWVLHWRYARAEALAKFHRAIELNPNLADGRYGLVLAHAGRAREAIAWLKRVIRLDPYHRPIVLSYLANAYFLAGDDQASVDTSRIAVERMPNVIQAHIWHAAAAARLGLRDEAEQAVGNAKRLRSDLTASEFVRSLQLALPADAERLSAALIKAGLPR